MFANWNDVDLEILLVEEELIEGDSRRAQYEHEINIKRQQMDSEQQDLVHRKDVLKEMKRMGMRFYKS